jgi:hypothetical protein
MRNPQKGKTMNEYPLAVDRYRATLAHYKDDEVLKNLIDGRDECLARFQPIFSPSALHGLTEEQFKSFLVFENNKHWTGLNRKGHQACADMEKLRTALALLLDEEKLLADRVNQVADQISGMGKALISAILLVAYPDRYGVWNNTSETVLKALRIWPIFERGQTLGERYQAVNQVLLRLAADVEVDLWVLDALHWRLVPENGGTTDPPVEATDNGGQCFGLERHLHHFLLDNWERMPLGRDWAIYAEQGDSEAGYEYPTDIGRIDLLAKHCKDPRWLVVELKRNQSTDDTLGQILRYIGWVRRNLATEGDRVEGIIVCQESDDRLRYAVAEIPHVKVMLYQVSFSLRPDPNSL